MGCSPSVGASAAPEGEGHDSRGVVRAIPGSIAEETRAASSAVENGPSLPTVVIPPFSSSSLDPHESRAQWNHRAKHDQGKQIRANDDDLPLPQGCGFKLATRHLSEPSGSGEGKAGSSSNSSTDVVFDGPSYQLPHLSKIIDGQDLEE